MVLRHADRTDAPTCSRRRSSWCAIISAASAYFFWQMPDDAGHEISGRKAVEISSRKGAASGRRQGRERRHPGCARSAAGLIPGRRPKAYDTGDAVIADVAK